MGNNENLVGIDATNAAFTLNDGLIEIDVTTGTVNGQVVGLRRTSDGEPTYTELFLSISCDGATGEANLITLPDVSPTGQAYPYDSNDPFTASFNQQDDRLIGCIDPIVLVRRPGSCLNEPPTDSSQPECPFINPESDNWMASAEVLTCA